MHILLLSNNEFWWEYCWWSCIWKRAKSIAVEQGTTTMYCSPSFLGIIYFILPFRIHIILTGNSGLELSLGSDGIFVSGVDFGTGAEFKVTKLQNSFLAPISSALESMPSWEKLGIKIAFCDWIHFSHEHVVFHQAQAKNFYIQAAARKAIFKTKKCSLSKLDWNSCNNDALMVQAVV